MDVQRLAFLDDIEDDLTTAGLDRTVETNARSGRAGWRSRLTRGFGVVGLLLLAGVPLVGYSATAAHASAAASVRPAVIYCGIPNPVPRTHTKSCNDGAWYLHTFMTSYPHGPGGQGTCYVFDRTYYGCGGESDAGYYTVCD
jgi:hypothetical protein